MELLLIIATSITTLILIWCLACSLYLLLLSLGNSYPRRKKVFKKADKPIKKIHFLIPAYKNDAVLIKSVEKNFNILSKLTLDWEYVVLGDQLENETKSQLKSLGVVLFDVQLENPTKSRAINQWLEKTELEQGSFIFLLDVDNHLVEQNLHDFLLSVDREGADWYQFMRTAANQNSDIASLDAWSEMVNNKWFRTGAQKLGIRPALIGSGMLAPADSFENIHAKIDVTGGFDKWVEHYLIKQRIPLVYLPELQVLDQKTSNIDALQKQRTRWVSAQFETAKSLFAELLKALISLRITDFLKYAQLYLIPRVLHIFLSVALLFSFFLNENLGLLALVNLTALLLAIFWVTPISWFPKIAMAVVKNGSRIIWNYLSMGKDFKKAKEKFLVTDHGNSEDNSN
ncbi:glycosyltransferase [Luteibaculum oceani]|uniref:Glycosyltransferase family 2 protein n=1 Tax=Luteibaculum oceani TaxID=1294296 RepID=A0A5C6V251_9FLAO|nr:glycosyltransferase [Luteibaculum oceani]TXC77125.1 glycosyltransferase family 2 protein [Luteibaculum oceani]